MTHRLYYTDPMLVTFRATVLACEPVAGGFDIVLDRTAFYPTSGGQPFDTGAIDGVSVVGVAERDDGTIAHTSTAPVSVGGQIDASIDWPRRFDHMQQHTGQHLLSAAFDRLFGVRTVSFHMGAELSTIDLAREVSAAEIAAAERVTNGVVWDDRPVTVRFVDAADAAALPLRKESGRTGELRLVEIPDFDLSACGGTHVPRTGMVGLVATTASERFKGGSRITFACGGRALASHARLRDLVAASVRVLATSPSELPAGIERLQSELRTVGKANQQLEEELSVHRAAALRSAAELVGEVRFVAAHQPTADAGALKRMAAAIVADPGFAVVLTGLGAPTPFVVARSRDIEWDASSVVKRVAGQFGGRGGGRPELAQGGAQASPDAIVTFVRQQLAPGRSA